MPNKNVIYTTGLGVVSLFGIIDLSQVGKSFWPEP